jgi:predicted transcriptional regulator
MVIHNVDEEILDYLKHQKECKTRKILDHMRDEYGDFARSTLWFHLVNLLNKGTIKRRLTLNQIAYWSLSESKKE